MGTLLAAPFLPTGRGALILILGGLMMLPIALFMSRMGAPHAPQGRPARQPRRAGDPNAPLAFVPVAPIPAPATAPQAWPAATPRWQEAWATPATPARPWAGTGLERALRQAVGGTHLLASAPGHYVVRLDACTSCARHAYGCAGERMAIERAVAPYLRDAVVAERACHQQDRRLACTFDIRGR